jgi:hypothetical protein
MDELGSVLLEPGSVLLEPQISFVPFSEAVSKVYMYCDECEQPLRRAESYIYPGTIDARERGLNKLMHKRCYSKTCRLPLTASSRIE